MNRRREYDELLQELQRLAAVDAVARARQRLRRRRMWTRPALSLAAVAAVFVLLVNFCAPVARACAGVPVLKELAQLVSFSGSLTEQLAHEGAQFVGQTQEENGVSVYVDSLIVDQKRLTVFFRVDTDIAQKADVAFDLLDEEGYAAQESAAVSCDQNDENTLNGQMRSVTLDFGRQDVPDDIRLLCCVGLHKKDGRALTEADDMRNWNVVKDLGDYDARLIFHLNIESQRIIQGYEKELNRELMLDGQRILLERVNIYPSKAEIHMKGADENTAWLETLDYHLECGDGTTIRPGLRDVLWEGEANHDRRKYYCESPYYHMPDGHVRLVIDGATWLDKDQQLCGVNLKTGETVNMIKQYAFDSVREEAGLVVLRMRLREKERVHPYGDIIGLYFTEPVRSARAMSCVKVRNEKWFENGKEIGRMEDFYLDPEKLDGDWVYFDRQDNRYWQPDQPIAIELQMD